MKSLRTLLSSLIVICIILTCCSIPSLAYGSASYQAPEILLDDSVCYLPENPAEVGFIFYCGAFVDYRDYNGILGGLAERGYFTASLKCPLNIAMLNPFGALQLMNQHPEIHHWFIGGHSMGGVVASFLAMDLFGRFEGVVLLASYSIVPISVPALSIYGTNDGVLVKPFYQLCKPLVSSHLTEMVLQGGNHAQYGNYGFQFLDHPADISMEEQQQTCINAIDQFIQSNRK